MVFTVAGKRIRPFSYSAKVSHNSYSTPLQRVIVDFGSEVSFADASQLIKEHYGVDIPISSIRSITERHAKIIQQDINNIQKEKSHSSDKPIIMESDGAMVPLITMQEDAEDKRKTRSTSWTEHKLSLAYLQGDVDPIYASTMEGADVAGKQFSTLAELVGKNDTSRIHFVADGAPWISDQVEEQFGSQATFLIDFFHLSDYLYKAAECCAPEQQTQWAETQKTRMKEGKISIVMQELEKYINHASTDTKHDCAAQTCYNYMIKRLKQFNYKDALASDLPIGSGKVESGHRSVIQSRLKRPGAWWLRENAASMGSLRVLKANGYYNDYWKRYKMSETTCSN